MTKQNDFQQLSTPASYAGLCAWVGEGARVLEPSAGTGALCTFALAAGATVHSNELSNRRADLQTAFLVPRGAVLMGVGAATVVTLLVLGVLAAYAGGASLVRGALRVTTWGILAMAATAAVGKLVGVAL